MGKVIGMGAALAAGLAVAGMAHASVITQSISYGPNGPVTNPFTQTMDFNQFNTGLGTLTSVTIQIDDASTGTVEVTNNSSGSSNYTISLGEQLNLTDSNSTQLSTFLDQSNSQSHTIAASGSYTITATATGTSPLTTINSNLSEFIGNNTIDLTLSGSGVALVSGATPYSASTNSTSSGAVTLDYYYSNPAAVPLPGSGALALVGGLALVGRMAIRRRMAH
jgi:hypothetical protein